jgi:deazaflavin-dependent oxidoreductase (nitroreductase family)
MVDAEFLKALKSSSELQITVTGRKTGRKISLPVWFIQENGTLWLLPVYGSDTNWYRNVAKEPTMQISIGGKKLTVKAKPVTDSLRINEVADKFKAKHGAGEVKKYYSKFDACVELQF